MWLFGNTLEVIGHKLFLFDAFETWATKYGPVFRWFWGPQPVITVRGKLIQHTRIVSIN